MSSAHGCPFHSGGKGISLGEIGGIVRSGDRSRMKKAIDQLAQAIRATPDLEEAKGEALTFIAILTVALLEVGAGKDMHRVQLDAARLLEPISTHEQVVRAALEIAVGLTASICVPIKKPNLEVVDAILAYLNDNLDRELTDEVVAQHFAISVSHFRYLFREVTGKPYSQFVMALRLERAKEMIVSDPFQPINLVWRACGFHAAAHFTRSFTRRFSATPDALRRSSIALQVGSAPETDARTDPMPAGRS